MRDLFPTTTDQASWAAALLGLLPFFLAGPLRIALSYHPAWAPGGESHLYFWYLLFCTVLVAGGLLLGAARKFPRWVYPYPLYLAFSLNMVFLYALYLLHGQAHRQAYTLLILGAILLVFCLPGLNTFYRRIRQDWTLLSYGVFGLVLYLLAGVDYDETPTLTLLALLPSLLTLLTALAHLRIRPAPERIAALLAGTFASLLVWLLPIASGMVTPWIGILFAGGMLFMWASVLGGLMLAPLLLAWALQTWRAGRPAG